jgi:hypothetical protein
VAGFGAEREFLANMRRIGEMEFAGVWLGYTFSFCHAWCGEVHFVAGEPRIKKSHLQYIRA